MEHYSEKGADSGSEGTSADEDLEEPVKKLDEEFFNEPFSNVTDLFTKYFKAIKKNRYFLTLLDNVLTETEPCDINPNTLPKPRNEVKRYRLPLVSGGLHKFLPSASKNIDMITRNNKGKCLVSNSKIKVGDNLVVEKAALFTVLPNCACRTFNHFRCHYCAAVIFKFVPCTDCDICLFCNESCRKAAWNSFHRFECYGLQRHFWRNDLAHIGFRLMMLSMSEIVSESENAPPKAVSKTASKPSTEPKIDSGAAASMERFWYLSSLESHLNDLTCKQRNELLHASARSLVYLIERTNFFTLLLKSTKKKVVRPYYSYMYVGGLLVRLTCLAQFISLQVPVRDYFGEVGNDIDYAAAVICTTASLINHSCEPNCIVIHNADTVIIRAIRKIEPGEEITISYHPITLIMSYSLRQWHCQKYHFTCCCDVCLAGDVDVTFHDSYRCRSCGGRIVYNEQNAFCLDCIKEEEEDDFFRHAGVHAEVLFKKFKATSQLHYALKALKAFEDTYYELNYRLYIVYQHIYKYLLNHPDYVFDAWELSLRSLLIHSEHHGKNAIEHALVIYRTLMHLISHKSFRKAQWDSNHFALLSTFKCKLQEAELILSFYYPPDRLEFLKTIDEALQKALDRTQKS